MLALIVDDTAADRKLLRYYLERRHWEIEEAVNGVEALEKARQLFPDLIVSDALMPVMDGFQLLRELRRSPPLAETPFIIYTSTYLTDRDREFALVAGADEYLAKPQPPEELWRVIDTVLKRKEEGRTAKPAPMSETEYLRKYHEVLLGKLKTSL